MIIREIITRITNTETGEVTEKSNIINGKLYGLFNVVSNKTVRANEKFHKTWINKKDNVPSEKLEKTNRGYFIDGYNVDQKAVDDWFIMTDALKPKKHGTFKRSSKNRAK